MLSVEDNELLVRVGPGTGMGELLRRFWIPVMLAEELPKNDSDPVRVEVLGEKFVAFRDTDGKVGVIDTYCPHRRANLFWGRNEEHGLRCAYHGWKFDVAGRCMDVPNAPNGDEVKPWITTRACEVEERGGLIWIYMGPKDEIPEFPYIDICKGDASHRRIGKFETDGNWLQLMEGDVDSSHISFLHKNLDGHVTPGRRSNPGVYNDTKPRWIVRNTEYGTMLAAQRNAEPDTYLWRVNQWLMPFCTLVAGRHDGPMLANFRIPVNDEQSLFFRVLAHPTRPLTADELSYTYDGISFPELIPGTFKTKENKSNDYLIDRDAQRHKSFTGIKSITAQDLAMGQDQGGGLIADRSREQLMSSDVAIVNVRRRLLGAVRSLQAGERPKETTNSRAYQVRAHEVILPREDDIEQYIYAARDAAEAAAAEEAKAMT